LILTARCEDIGYVEYAVGILVLVDALGGQRLDVAQDAVLECEGLVERRELVVGVVNLRRVREVNGENTNALGGCVGQNVSISSGAMAASCVTYTCWSAHRTITKKLL
jgi:hypothetical protein